MGPSSGRRIRLVDVEATSPGSVRLRRGDTIAAGAIPDGDDRYEAVVAATLEAVAQLIPPVASFAVEGTHLITGERDVLVVVVTITVAGAVLPHAGSVLVGADPDVAAAKATLNAVNRRIAILGY